MKQTIHQTARNWQSVIRRNKLHLYRSRNQAGSDPLREGLLPYEYFWALGIPFLRNELDLLSEDRAMMLLPDDKYLEDPRMEELAQGCAEGDPAAMWDMAEYFEAMYALHDDERFFQLASNYWRFHACLAGDPLAAAWILEWAQQNPGQQLPSILDESHYTEGLNGRFFQHLGHCGFEAGVFYAVRTSLYGITTVCEYPHRDGSWDASNYRTTFRDEYLNPLPVGSAYHHPAHKPTSEDLAGCMNKETASAVLLAAERNLSKRVCSPFVRRFF